MRLDRTFTWNIASTYTHTHTHTRTHTHTHTHTCTHTHTQCPPRTIKRLIDKNLAFHKAIAWMIILSSAIHVIAHWYNYERLVATPNLQVFLERFPWEQRRIPNLAQPSLPPVQPVSQQQKQCRATRVSDISISHVPGPPYMCVLTSGMQDIGGRA